MFVIGSVRLWRALVIATVVAGCQQSVSFQSAKLSTTDSAPPKKIGGLLAKPEGVGPFPGVVLLHTCGGMQPHITQDWPNFLNRIGYVTLAVDSLGPRGMSRCTRELVASHRELTRDAYGALDYLAERPFVDPTRIGVMGFSMGAITINYFAGRHMTSPRGLNFKAAISLYGGCYSIQLKPTVRRIPMKTGDKMIPLAVIVGGNERHRVVSSCKAVDGKGPVRTHVLAGAYHAFDNPNFTTIRHDLAGNPMLYSRAATEKAKHITRAFFAAELGTAGLP